MAITASSRVRPLPTVLSMSMMSPTTRIRTVRRRSSRLFTWLYSAGPLVPSWMAGACRVSAPQPSRWRKVSAALTMESRLSLAGRAGPRGRPLADCGSGRAAITDSPFDSSVGPRDRVSEKLTPQFPYGSVDALLTELGKLAGDRAQIGQHRRIHRLDRPGDDVAALGHVDAARVRVVGLEALVAVKRQLGERTAGLSFQRPLGVHIAPAVPPGRDAHANAEGAQHRVLLPEAPGVADDNLGEQRRSGGLVHVGVGDPVAVGGVEAAARRRGRCGGGGRPGGAGATDQQTPHDGT